jgi:prevent-host-death family protein
MDVGVRELKQRLSEYLDRAAGGEVIRVTDRGVPKAVLGPIPGQDRIEQGIREGWITPGSGKPPLPGRPVAPRPGARLTTDLIAEDREDGF